MTSKVKRVLLITCIIFLNFTLVSCYELSSEARGNRKVILKRIEENYGEDYEIIYENFNGWTIGARQIDGLMIKQNGVYYYISAENGEIYDDNYPRNYAGKLIIDHYEKDLLPQIAEHDYFLECTVYYYGKYADTTVIDPSDIPETFEELAEMDDISVELSLIIYAEEKENRGAYEWVYEFMNKLPDTFEDASLHLLVTNIENKQCYETVTNEAKCQPAKDYYSGGASSIKKDTFENAFEFIADIEPIDKSRR